VASPYLGRRARRVAWSTWCSAPPRAACRRPRSARPSRSTGRPRPACARPVRVGSPWHEVDHEASMALLAAAAGVRRQVAVLHRAGIAHGDLAPDNLLVDRDGRPWLVDFDQAVAGADRRLLARDLADLEAALGAPAVSGSPSRAAS